MGVVQQLVQDENYAGLGTLPPGSFEVVRMNQSRERKQKFYRCKVGDCRETFKKSTRIVVHVWKHLNLRPFKCP